ncbi:hypothetical protein J5N97_023967 [Dioscorea zingiberensis]|uniref:SPT2 chromatin protein n=1 Tax=Dioscorea zingiberensis TaxID=325984 RepID=A0A9D5H8D8_9LILI|nr:hypothetical protein J5N97_023967 [Dioscorea zingiberensis]
MRGYERDYDRDGYEQDAYDDYDEEEDGGEEEEEEERKPTKEEQDFLKLREQLKERFRRNLKKESSKVLGHTSRSLDQRKTANDKFGSFFGPSQPAIAQRVIEESRSIRETQHIAAKVQSSSSNSKKNPASISSGMKMNQRPKVVNEIKKKAQTLKDSRDYSFLLSDDADMPVPEKDQSAPRMTSGSSSDGRSSQAPSRNKLPINKPARQGVMGHDSRNSASTNRPMLAKGSSVKEALVNRPRLPSSESRKVVGNVSGRPAGKILPSKLTTQAVVTNRPPPKVANALSLEKKISAKPQLTTQNHFSAHRKVSQVPDKVLTTKRQPEISLKHQPPKRNPLRDVHEERLKKKPPKRRSYSDDEGEEAINMIRQMFRYDPRRFSDMDGDDSDMEVGFDSIQKEERKSAKIAKMEDEEQLRLIEEEERRERMRKKQKLSHHR